MERNKRKLLVLTILFLFTTFIVYSINDSGAVVRRPPLQEYFKSIDGFQLVRSLELGHEAFTMLNLDDYAYADYRGPLGEVNLYIGYYYSAGKAYAAHSPLVCYPSQGWQIEQGPEKGTLSIDGHTVHYEEIVTALDGRKELVMYWYQAGGHTNTQVYANKIDMGYNKLMHDNPQHAFVRVAAPLVDGDLAKTRAAVAAFMQTFYPQFSAFIQSKDA